jgi:hypothetical protein
MAAGASWLAASADDGSVGIWGLDGVERARLNPGRTRGRAPVVAFSPDVAAPALALGDQNGDVDLVTLGRPMPPDLAELIARALAFAQ